MKKSVFQFSDPHMVSLEFSAYNRFVKDEFKGFDFKSKISNAVVEENIEAFVRLDLAVGEKSIAAPFVCKIGMMARFRVEQEVSPDEFQKFLDINAPALLMSYTMPIVSFVAAQAGFASFNIPYINFTGNEKQ